MLLRACLLVAISMVGLAGCSSSDAGGSSKQSSNSSSSPDQAVQRFLHSVQSGDEKTAADMLTMLARQKTSEQDLEVAPPGSKTATFEVGEVEMLDDNSAYVASTWSDVDADGTRHNDQIVWVVRREPEGWRIAGMVTKLNDKKLILNFEDPEDMLQKQKMAAEEMEAQAAQNAEAAFKEQQFREEREASRGGAGTAPRLK